MNMTQWHDLLKIVVSMFINTHVVSFLIPPCKPLATAILGFTCSIDVLIAGTLCILLHRARTGFKRCDWHVFHDSSSSKLILLLQHGLGYQQTCSSTPQQHLCTNSHISTQILFVISTGLFVFSLSPVIFHKS